MSQASLAERQIDSNASASGLYKVAQDASLAEIVRQGILRTQQAHRIKKEGQKSHS